MDKFKDVSARTKQLKAAVDEAITRSEARWKGLEEELEALMGSDHSSFDATLDEGMQITIELNLTIKRGDSPSRNA